MRGVGRTLDTCLTWLLRSLQLRSGAQGQPRGEWCCRQGESSEKGCVRPNRNATDYGSISEYPLASRKGLHRVGHLSAPSSSLLPDIGEAQPTSQALSSSVTSATILASLSFFPPGFLAKTVSAPPVTSGSVPMR